MGILLMWLGWGARTGLRTRAMRTRSIGRCNAMQRASTLRTDGHAD